MLLQSTCILGGTHLPVDLSDVIYIKVYDRYYVIQGFSITITITQLYKHPYVYFFIVHVYMEEDLCGGGGGGGGVVYFTVMFDHPSCFLTFYRSGIPTSCYILTLCLRLSHNCDARGRAQNAAVAYMGQDREGS